jgi:hypothetical protein
VSSTTPSSTTANSFVSPTMNPPSQPPHNNSSNPAPEHPELSQLSQADLNGLVSTLDDDDDDLFKQLGEAGFELDPLLDEILEDHNRSRVNHGNGNREQHQQQQQHSNFGNNSSPSLQQFLSFHGNNNNNNNNGANNGLGRSRKKPPDNKGMLMEISLEEAAPNILQMARAKGGSPASILANTLCSGGMNKANIAAANPILAGK